MRYLLIITYDGENFCGWQKQKNDRTVQEEIEKALTILLKQSVSLIGSGRTDAGVNALRQKAHFDSDKTINNQSKFIFSLNGILPKDVRILEIETTDKHARFSAKNKTYLYKMYKSNCDLPLMAKSLRLDENIELKKMKKFAKFLVGTHDFKNFCCSGSEVENTVRTIFSIKFVETKNEVLFYICGNGFLYKMVRNIVGLLIEVGKGKLTKEEFLLSTFGDKSVHKKTAPANALFLYDVVYDTTKNNYKD